jgi:hypothetical protein
LRSLSYGSALFERRMLGRAPTNLTLLAVPATVVTPSLPADRRGRKSTVGQGRAAWPEGRPQ